MIRAPIIYFSFHSPTFYTLAVTTFAFHGWEGLCTSVHTFLEVFFSSITQGADTEAFFLNFGVRRYGVRCFGLIFLGGRGGGALISHR